VEAEYVQAISETVSLAAWRRIVRRAKEDAEQGDHRAREWLSRYLVGEPNKRSTAATGRTANNVRIRIPHNHRDELAGEDARQRLEDLLVEECRATGIPIDDILDYVGRDWGTTFSRRRPTPPQHGSMSWEKSTPDSTVPTIDSTPSPIDGSRPRF
jgi:hypothetical protein